MLKLLASWSCVSKINKSIKVLWSYSYYYLEAKMALKDSEDFSCDLVSEAKRHLLFLKTIHALGVTLVHSFAERPSKESLCRYYKLWLPLVGLKSKDIIDKGFPEGLAA